MKSLQNILFFICIVASVCSACKTRQPLSKSSEKSAATKSDAITSTAKDIQRLKKKYALLLSVDENKIENVALYQLIDSWYGTVYKYGGCTKDGIDCSNFAAILYQEIYQQSLKGSSGSIYNLCKMLSTNELQEGDLLFFKIEKNNISHIGVYLQNNKFVHATTKKGVMINDLEEAYYKKYFFKAGRLK